MFIVDNNIADLKVKERNIFKLLYSMNNHPVATPEMSVEEARCYILFFSEGPNLSAYIGLYLPHTDRKFFYAYTSNPFPYEAERDVESEARAFAEDMGFLLDEINISGMTPDDRNHWIEEQHIFGYKKPDVPEKPEQLSVKPQSADVDKPTEKPAAPEAPVGNLASTAAAPDQSVAPVQQPHPPVPPQQPQPQPQQVVIPQQPVYPQQPVAPVQQPHPPVQAEQPVQQVVSPHQPVVLDEPIITPTPTPAPALRAKTAPKRKTPAAKPVPHPAPPPQQAEIEEEVQVDVEIETTPTQPHTLMEEAVKKGVVKPSKPKTTLSASSTITRDKEALARLLASF